ncbi:hypothetical protein YP72344_32140 [Yersinia pseudotuberculosis]|nr:hypothetical protein YP72344_32140 [Yersinia pseudotuberculosis]BET63507.1 hypothetical protein YPSE1_29660 [Yersinia pseudotuberculosis]
MKSFAHNDIRLANVSEPTLERFPDRVLATGIGTDGETVIEGEASVTGSTKATDRVKATGCTKAIDCAKTV